MPLAPESFQALDDSLSRLAAESILALPGRDDGLIPSYSLLGEMREQCASEPALRDAIAAVHARLDRRLDTAQPFDEATLAELRRLIAWLPEALEAAKAGRAPRPSSANRRRRPPPWPRPRPARPRRNTPRRTFSSS
ncbi:hypothetical protein [Oleiharenicola sp. Vm1]|uniref:hypothetical protein n=1 Tax=Oleiharenicola sp. Vm1 TaxID=3398393 RepID=UPI0039F5705F